MSSTVPSPVSLLNVRNEILPLAHFTCSLMPSYKVPSSLAFALSASSLLSNVGKAMLFVGTRLLKKRTLPHSRHAASKAAEAAWDATPPMCSVVDFTMCVGKKSVDEHIHIYKIGYVHFIYPS